MHYRQPIIVRPEDLKCLQNPAYLTRRNKAVSVLLGLKKPTPPPGIRKQWSVGWLRLTFYWTPNYKFIELSTRSRFYTIEFKFCNKK